MSLTTFKAFWLAATLGLLLGGCGLTQRVVDGGSSVAQGIFYKQVKVLRLDFTGRAALNTATTDMSGLSVSTMVRIYQLKDRRAVDDADYQSLLNDGSNVLGADLLDDRQVLVKPGEGVQLNVPMMEETQYVAIVGLFRSPSHENNTWRLVLARNELNPDNPRVVELGDNALTLQPQPKKESWW